MKKIISVCCAFLIFGLSAYALTDVKPERIKKYIKKEKGLYGLWDADNKKWFFEPAYSKITGIAITEKEWDMENRIFFKLWKGETFDLLRVTEKDYKDVFEIWIRDVSEIRKPDLEFKYSEKDWFNFIYYQKQGKWGWFADKVEVLENGFFRDKENVVIDAKFDSPPIVTSFGKSQFYTTAYNNYILQVDSLANVGLYSLAGYSLVKPGPFSNFKLPESVDYKKEIFISFESVDGKFGYSLNGRTVGPLYSAIPQRKTKYYYVAPYELYECVLPSGEREWRKGADLLSKEQIKVMDAEEDLQALAAKEKEKLQKDKKTTTTANTVATSAVTNAKTDEKDSTEFVDWINGYIVFKYGGLFGLKDDSRKIVFPAVLTSIKKDFGESFEVSCAGVSVSRAYFGYGNFTGMLDCDVCEGTGYVKTTFHLSKDREKKVYRNYLGNGLWEEVTVITTTPPRDVQENTSCTRCDGLGTMKGGLQYANGSVKVWFWKDELQKNYNKKN